MHAHGLLQLSQQQNQVQLGQLWMHQVYITLSWLCLKPVWLIHTFKMLINSCYWTAAYNAFTPTAETTVPLAIPPNSGNDGDITLSKLLYLHYSITMPTFLLHVVAVPVRMIISVVVIVTILSAVIVAVTCYLLVMKKHRLSEIVLCAYGNDTVVTSVS